ncbi:MAG: hypothetical protein ACR2NB_14675 [Solirubrobacteraceae bacterium]
MRDDIDALLGLDISPAERDELALPQARHGRDDVDGGVEALPRAGMA